MALSSHHDELKYYLLSDTLVDESVAQKHLKILHENPIEINGLRLFTVTYEQVLQDFGVRNWNGRMYSKANTINSIKSNPLIQYDLSKDTWCAEYGHPDMSLVKDPTARQLTIDPKLACNRISKYWVTPDDKYLMGECTTLAGGYGEVLRDRILTGFPAMASSRALGGVDGSGNVLPGYTLVTFDSVIRPSHKTAYQTSKAVKVNQFNVPMSESALSVHSDYSIPIDINSDSFKDFLMSESVSKEKINIVCDMMNLDYDSMQLRNGNVYIDKISENGLCKDTIVMPINRLINESYFNLF